MAARTRQPIQTRPKRSPAFAAALRQALKGASDLPLCARERIREDLRLQFDYPNEYVAFIDQFRVQSGVRHFVRVIVAHASSLPRVHAAIATLGPAERARLDIRYVDNPLTPSLHVHYDLPQR